jgi:hypothetical protein
LICSLFSAASALAGTLRVSILAIAACGGRSQHPG